MSRPDKVDHRCVSKEAKQRRWQLFFFFVCFASLSVHLQHTASFHRRGPLSHVGKSKTGSAHNGHMSNRWPTAAGDDTVCIWQTPAVVATGRKTAAALTTAVVTQARACTLKSNSRGTSIHQVKVGLLSRVPALRNKPLVKSFLSLVTVLTVFKTDVWKPFGLLHQERNKCGRWLTDDD